MLVYLECSLPNAASDVCTAITRTSWFIDAVDTEQHVLNDIHRDTRSSHDASLDTQDTELCGESPSVASAPVGYPHMPGIVSSLPTSSAASSCVSIPPASSHTPTDFESSLRSMVFSHRPKNAPTIPFFSCVARPVGRREIEERPAVQQAMADEWSKLAKHGVFDMDSVREWSDVRDEARSTGATVHHGSLATM